MVFLASTNLVGDLFRSWEQAGFFEYLFPLLLIFAIVFGILTKLNLFKDNKALNGLIALVVALIAIQQNFVSEFFEVLFPRLGIALILFLSVIILIGLALPPKWDGVLLAVGAVIVIVTLVSTSGALGWSSGSWWRDSWVNIIGLIIFVAIIGAIIFGGRQSDDAGGTSMLGKLLSGE